MNNVVLFYFAFACYFLSAIFYFVFLFHGKEKISYAALAALILGAVSHLAAMFLRMKLSGYPPLTNLFESMSFFALVIVLVYLVTEIKHRLNILGSFVMPVVLLILYGALSAPKVIEPLLPALKSNWLPVHVSLSFISYAGFTVSFGMGIAYLIQERQVKSRKIGKIYYRLPSLEALDELVYKLIAFGFPFLTMGIITGAIWANQAWGSYWSWDPKEVWSLITWLVYAFYLHARLLRGWRGKNAAYLSIIGFIVVIFTFLGVNLLTSGLHSYL